MQISDNPLQLALPDSSLVRHGPTALSLSLSGSHGGGSRGHIKPAESENQKRTGTNG